MLKSLKINWVHLLFWTISVIYHSCSASPTVWQVQFVQYRLKFDTLFSLCCICLHLQLPWSANIYSNTDQCICVHSPFSYTITNTMLPFLCPPKIREGYGTSGSLGCLLAMDLLLVCWEFGGQINASGFL